MRWTDRQRAMLAEMGIRLWEREPAAAVDDGREAAVAVAESAAATSAPTVAPTAVPRRFGESEFGPSPDAGPALPAADWLVVGEPLDAGAQNAQAQLLDNMLRALQLHGGAVPVHLMRTHRAAGSERTDREHEPQPFGEGFLPQAGALAPRVILAMGPLAAQSLLQSADPLGRLRGRAVPLAALGGVPVVATLNA